MKKVSKRLVALVMTVMMMMVVLAACGSKEKDAIIGSWKITSMEMSDTTIDAAMLEASGMAVTLEVKDDKTFSMVANMGEESKTEEGTWKSNGNGKYVLDQDGEGVDVTVEDGKLTFLPTDGTSMVFEKQ